MLTKNIFRTSIRDIILRYMIEGILKPGERLSLPMIADDLEVSATPVREALTQLTETGIVTYIPNRGFFVTELSQKDALDIYGIISILESEAVKHSQFKGEDFESLRHINERFKNAESPKDKLELDRLFHQKLVENYDNQYAKKIIQDINVRVFIYEHEFMSTAPIESSYYMHKRILDYLEKGNLDEAAQEVRKNWQISMEHIIQTYQSKNHEI